MKVTGLRAVRWVQKAAQGCSDDRARGLTADLLLACGCGPREMASSALGRLIAEWRRATRPDGAGDADVPGPG